MDDFLQTLLAPVENLGSLANNDDSNVLKDVTDDNEDLDFLFFSDNLSNNPNSINEADERLSQFHEDAVVKQACTEDTDLRQYADITENQLFKAEADLVLKFVELMPSIIDLNKNIEICDTVLTDMQTLLVGFRDHLGALNKDIKNLQEDSKTIQNKLQNRLSVHENLKKIVDGLVITPEMIKIIMDGRIGDQYLECIMQLDAKIGYAQAKTNLANGTSAYRSRNRTVIKAIKTIGPEHDKLRFKAANTIRKFFLDTFSKLDSSRTAQLMEIDPATKIPSLNLNLVQDQILLPYKELNFFVIRRHIGVAAEIAQHYTNYTAAFHASRFRLYLKGMQRLQLQGHDKDDLLGFDATAKKSLLDYTPFRSSSVAVKDKVDRYSLAERVKVLNFSPESLSVIRVEDQVANTKTYWFEELFKSFNVLLAASLNLEYTFIEKFFTHPNLKGKAKQHLPAELIVENIFKAAFDAVFKRANTVIKEFTDTTNDALSVLLCIRLNFHFESEIVKRRGIPLVDTAYYHMNERLLWPKFQSIINNHIASLKKANLGGNLSIQDTTLPDVVKKFSDFIGSILTLAQDFNEPMLINGIGRLRNEFVGLMTRTSEKINDDRLRVVFLLNCYDQVLSTLDSYPNKAVPNATEFFKNEHEAALKIYLDLELRTQFGSLMSFLDQCESGQLNCSMDRLKDRFSALILEFNSNWKIKLSTLANNCQKSFLDNNHAVSNRQALMAHLMVTYARFLATLDDQLKSVEAIENVTPISVNQLMLEIRRWRN